MASEVGLSVVEDKELSELEVTVKEEVSVELIPSEWVLEFSVVAFFSEVGIDREPPLPVVMVISLGVLLLESVVV